MWVEGDNRRQKEKTSVVVRLLFNVQLWLHLCS